jgi:glutathionyl-hydroquinone reductase
MTFKMQMGEIRRNVNQFDERANRAIGGIFKYQESRSEVHMKTSAPWTDRTGNARNGLSTCCCCRT